MIAFRLSHGMIVKEQVKTALVVRIDVPRCTLKPAHPRCSPNIALQVLYVPRTRTLPAKVQLVRLNVTSAVVMVTTATLARLLGSVVSCC